MAFCGTLRLPGEFNMPTVRDVAELGAAESGRAGYLLLWGTAMLVRREAMQAAGPLDERYFAYYEDFDLTDRIHKAGYRNRVCPAAKIWHAGNPSICDRPPYYVYYNVRNHFIFWSDRCGPLEKLRYWRFFTLRTVWFLADLKDTASRDRLEAAVCAFRDAWLGRHGKWNDRRRAPGWLYRLATAHPYALKDLLEGNFRALLSRTITRLRGGA